MSNEESNGTAEQLRESISTLPPWLIATTTAVLGAAGWGMVEWLAPATTEWALPARLVLLVVLAGALVFLILGQLYLRLWLRQRTREAFGVLWNRRGNPICSKCRVPLTKSTGTALFCSACQIGYSLYDLTTGGKVNVWDAYKIMRPKSRRFRREMEVPQRKENGSKQSEKEHEYPDRSEIETRILVLLAKHKQMPAHELASEIRTSSEVAQFHLDELFGANLVEWTTDRQALGTVWRLKHNGVGYLVERGLHK
jgi:uncharacterized Zn finger protein (UPF0148 family)